MSDPRPAYHCGALECCEGSMYPDCMAPHIEPTDTPARSSHYEDDTPGKDACPHTD